MGFKWTGTIVTVFVTVQTPGCGLEVRRAHHRVAPVDGLRPVPRELHVDRARDAGLLHVPHRGAPKIMLEEPRHPGPLARRPPRPAKVPDRAPREALPEVREEWQPHGAQPPLEGPDPCELLREK